MTRRHDPPLPIDRDGNAVIIPFPGVHTTPTLEPSTATGFPLPEDEWTVCESCGEELMVGDICVWCEED